MKKSVFTLAVLAMLGFSFTAISCKDNKNNDKNKIESALEEAGDKIKEGAEKTGDAIKDAAEKTEDAVKDAAKDAKDKLEDEKDKLTEEASGKLTEAVESIQKTGNDFVKTIQDGGKKADIEAAQDKFHNAIQDAQAKYEEATKNGVPNNILEKAQQEISQISNDINAKAQKAMANR